MLLSVKNHLNKKYICIPESFNANILHKLLDNKITFVNSQLENQIQKVILY